MCVGGSLFKRTSGKRPPKKTFKGTHFSVKHVYGWEVCTKTICTTNVARTPCSRLPKYSCKARRLHFIRWIPVNNGPKLISRKWFRPSTPASGRRNRHDEETSTRSKRFCSWRTQCYWRCRQELAIDGNRNPFVPVYGLLRIYKPELSPQTKALLNRFSHFCSGHQEWKHQFSFLEFHNQMAPSSFGIFHGARDHGNHEALWSFGPLWCHLTKKEPQSPWQLGSNCWQNASPWREKLTHCLVSFNLSSYSCNLCPCLLMHV